MKEEDIIKLENNTKEFLNFIKEEHDNVINKMIDVREKFENLNNGETLLTSPIFDLKVFQYFTNTFKNLNSNTALLTEIPNSKRYSYNSKIPITINKDGFGYRHTSHSRPFGIQYFIPYLFGNYEDIYNKMISININRVKSKAEEFKDFMETIKDYYKDYNEYKDYENLNLIIENFKLTVLNLKNSRYYNNLVYNNSTEKESNFTSLEIRFIINSGKTLYFKFKNNEPADNDKLTELEYNFNNLKKFEFESSRNILTYSNYLKMFNFIDKNQDELLKLFKDNCDKIFKSRQDILSQLQQKFGKYNMLMNL
jgi:hypothetical protein